MTFDTSGENSVPAELLIKSIFCSQSSIMFMRKFVMPEFDTCGAHCIPFFFLKPFCVKVPESLTTGTNHGEK